MKKILILFIISISLFSIYSDDIIKGSVVKLYAVNNKYSFKQPWQLGTERSVTGSGVIIDKDRILTNAHVVANNSFLQLKKSGSTKKYTAEILFYGHECDLALLTVKDKRFFKDTIPVKMGDIPNIQDTISVYGFPRGGDKLSITSGKVNRIESRKYIHSERLLLSAQIDAPINPGNSGGPAIKDGKIAGIVFQGGGGENLGYIIPANVIMHFLDDIKDGDFDGFPILGIMYQQLENNDIKKYMGLDENSNGIFVTKTFYNFSCYDKIMPGDVLLSIDNINIANDGSVPFRNDDRIDLSYLVTKKQVGDHIKVKLYRGNKEIDENITLKNEDPLVTNYQFEDPPKYYVFGGLVFAPLSKDYIKYNPATDLKQYKKKEKKEDQEEAVVLQKVLAIDLTEGYHNLKNKVIKDIDGKKPRSFSELVEIIDTYKGKYLIVNLESHEKIILNYKSAKKENKKILEKYMIPQDRKIY